MELVGKIFAQNCGDDLLVINKTNRQQYGNKGRFYYHCKFIKYPYEIDVTKPEIEKGSVLNPQIEKIEFIDKEWPQNCGDTLSIIEKTNTKKGNSYLWKVKFKGYPCELLVTKTQILKGSVENPELKKKEFIQKEWPQHCGDTLKILEKIKDVYKCEFINYKHIVFCKKSNIILGKVDNSQIEKIEFLNKEWLQNCGDIIFNLEKTSEYNGKSRLYKGTFKKYPYTGLFTKQAIKGGSVVNPKIPWFSEKELKKYIYNNFEGKPTLKELSQKLEVSISHLSNKICEFQLNNLLKIDFSKSENELSSFIKNLISIEKNKYFSKDLFLDNQERTLDIYISDLKLGFEFNGNYWHSSLYKDRNYHQQRTISLSELEINLFHIWEYEWNKNKELCCSYIKSKLGVFKKKIGARKCIIKELDYKTYANFCDKNHLQGACGAKIKLGLFCKEELIQVMSFGSPRFTNDYEWEIIRECSKQGYCILGGKERLWKYFIETYNPTNCISYCDFSKFTGDSYLKLGFKFKQLNKPGFWWYDEQNKIVYPRTPWKHQEYKDKYLKIFDCGQLVFEWTK